MSFRPRELGRYGSIENWASLLAHTHHLTVSSRHNVMKAFANHEGIRTARGWPDKNANLNDPVFAELAAALSARMPAGAIGLLHRHSIGDTLFFTDDNPPIVIPASTGYGKETLIARLQGALLALTSLPSHDNAGSMNEASRLRLCTDTVRLAFQGTAERPWSYPSRLDTIT